MSDTGSGIPMVAPRDSAKVPINTSGHLEVRRLLELASTLSTNCYSDVYSYDLSVSSILHETKYCKGKAAERGRTIDRKPRIPHPLDRAESLRRKDEPAVEIDARFIQTRFRRSCITNADPRAIIGTLLESSSLDPVCNSVSEMIDGLVEKPEFGVDASSKMFSFLRTRSKSFLNLSIARKASNGTQTTNSINYVCCPSVNPPQVPLHIKSSTHFAKPSMISGPLLRSIVDLPAEIMHHIYLELHPADFNSARHACRSWYINSLERSLLQIMLIRGGWSTYILQEPALYYMPNSQPRASIEWLMSKSITRECALGPDWSGNGHCLIEKTPQCGSHNHISNSTPFVQTSVVDFTEIGVHYPEWDQSSSGIIFTVSTCSRFLMVVHGCLISIFELSCSHAIEKNSELKKSGSLRPVTKITCPRRVLACSMDTSSHRHAIAILLDGRVGLVCDLTCVRNHFRQPFDARYLAMQETHSGNEYRNRIWMNSSRVVGPDQIRPEQPFVCPVIAAEASQSWLRTDPRYISWYDLSHSNTLMQPNTQLPTSFPGTFDQLATSTIYFPLFIESSMPTLYTNLCRADDLPRSVALCPQRRCVAFGCSTGIELHWVDALTGQDLNRWFPLTAPSDYLYFLPPRAGVDNAKKLRLISSSAVPGEQSAMADRFGRGRTSSRAGDRGKTNPFWCVLPPSHGGGRASADRADISSSERLGRNNNDYYHAVPLSDGYHILFIDPITGLLCLGNDAPVGGPNKLLRKIRFVGPHGRGSPVAYAAGSDLSNGVRVVAAYGDGTEQGVWLFSIPIDIFTENLLERETNKPLFAKVRTQLESGGSEWTKWWRKFDSPGEDNFWPLEVRGQEIGTCRSVVDLAIDAGPEMTIWAFGRDGNSKAWQIDSGDLDGKIGKKYLVVRDGTVREVDPNGDVHMHDAPSPTGRSQTSTRTQDQDTLDGTTLMANSRIVGSQPLWGCHPSFSQHVEDFDGDGDVLMTDLPGKDEQNLGYETAHPVEAASAIPNGHVLTPTYHHSHFLDPLYAEQLRINRGDIIDVLTGITRIDIEIW